MKEEVGERVIVVCNNNKVKDISATSPFRYQKKMLSKKRKSNKRKDNGNGTGTGTTMDNTPQFSTT